MIAKPKLALLVAGIIAMAPMMGYGETNVFYFDLSDGGNADEFTVKNSSVEDDAVTYPDESVDGNVVAVLASTASSADHPVADLYCTPGNWRSKHFSVTPLHGALYNEANPSTTIPYMLSYSWADNSGSTVVGTGNQLWFSWDPDTTTSIGVEKRLGTFYIALATQELQSAGAGTYSDTLTVEMSVE